MAFLHAVFFFVDGSDAIYLSLYMNINKYRGCLPVMECSVYRGDGEAGCYRLGSICLAS